jgi:hypothetical protein
VLSADRFFVPTGQVRPAWVTIARHASA